MMRRYFSFGAFGALLTMFCACSADDGRLVGRWAEVNSLSCPGYAVQDAANPISMLRFNQDGNWAMSYQDGQLIFKGHYEAQPAAEGAGDYASELRLTIEEGQFDPQTIKLVGYYNVEENYLVIRDIWLDKNSPVIGCGHSFKRR